MASSRREYIAATFIISCVALVLLIVALATNSWITSQVNGNDFSAGEVNYGLFKGSYIKSPQQVSKYLFDISIVCDFGENACVWSCQNDQSSRKADLASLLAGKDSSISGCVFQPLKTVTVPMKITPGGTTSEKLQTTTTREASKGHRFINAGLWISTLLTLILAILLAATTALLSVVNLASNPVLVFLAVEGLYYWNGAAAAMDLLTLVLWGSQYAVTLKDNIALFELSAVNSTSTSAGLASLGWSYWMVLVALLFNAANVGVLFFRDYKLRKEPPPPTYNPDNNVADGTLFLY